MNLFHFIVPVFLVGLFVSDTVQSEDESEAILVEDANDPNTVQSKDNSEDELAANTDDPDTVQSNDKRENTDDSGTVQSNEKSEAELAEYTMTYVPGTDQFEDKSENELPEDMDDEKAELLRQWERVEKQLKDGNDELKDLNAQYDRFDYLQRHATKR